MSCEECVTGGENSLEWYVRNSLDILPQGVVVTGKMKSEETVSKNEFKTALNNELKLDSWKEKRLHGQFYEEYPEQHM